MMKSFFSYVASIRDAFVSPFLPMDADYSYEARQRESARLRRLQPVIVPILFC
jgi:hypothetical protein